MKIETRLLCFIKMYDRFFLLMPKRISHVQLTSEDEVFIKASKVHGVPALMNEFIVILILIFYNLDYLKKH